MPPLGELLIRTNVAMIKRFQVTKDIIPAVGEYPFIKECSAARPGGSSGGLFHQSKLLFRE